MRLGDGRMCNHDAFRILIPNFVGNACWDMNAVKRLKSIPSALNGYSRPPGQNRDRFAYCVSVGTQHGSGLKCGRAGVKIRRATFAGNEGSKRDAKRAILDGSASTRDNALANCSNSHANAPHDV